MHQCGACGLLIDVDRRAMARLALPVIREASIECNLVTAWPCSGARLNQDNGAIHLHGSGMGMQLDYVRGACDAKVCTCRVRLVGVECFNPSGHLLLSNNPYPACSLQSGVVGSCTSEIVADKN